ncbi:MAG TPA: RHS repeat-associated core domain-containing protein, partial [Terriglobales bacterium]|nr:RHS repeat-associated core domain-containing protein [Terriglobales bacterium]
NPDDSNVFTYNDLNQLEELVVTKPARFGQPAVSETITYTYDLNGNRYTRDDGTNETQYAYDYDNRLLSVTAPDQPTYSYTYDYRTRRVVIADDPGDGGTIDYTALSFSGGTSVQEYPELSTSESPPNVEYIRGSDLGGGIGGILYTLRDGTPSFTHYNARGDVVAKTDSSNNLTYQATYDAFGTRPEEVGSTDDRQKANTKDEDPTGLLNEGHRYRDLETNEFLTGDPIGFNDGPNLYTYVHQNPWSHFDPEGLLLIRPSHEERQVAPHVVAETNHILGKIAKGLFVTGPVHMAQGLWSSTVFGQAHHVYQDVRNTITDIKSPKGYLAAAEARALQEHAAFRAEIKRLVTTPQGAGEVMFNLVTIAAGMAVAGRAGTVGASARAAAAQTEEVIMTEGHVWRGGGAGPKALMPRARKDTTGLSTFETPEHVWEHSPNSDEAQRIAIAKLKDLKAVKDSPPEGHVSLTPKDASKLKDWFDNPNHPLGKEVKEAIVGKIKRPKPPGPPKNE